MRRVQRIDFLSATKSILNWLLRSATGGPKGWLGGWVVGWVGYPPPFSRATERVNQQQQQQQQQQQNKRESKTYKKQQQQQQQHKTGGGRRGRFSRHPRKRTIKETSRPGRVSLLFLVFFSFPSFRGDFFCLFFFAPIGKKKNSTLISIQTR